MQSKLNRSNRAVHIGRDVSTTPGVYLLVLFSVILFIAGFFSGEDALGGGIRNDLYSYHLPTMLAFRHRPFLTVLPYYNSATTPLFHILESFNPLLGHDTAFRATNTFLSLLVCALFALTIGRRFEPIPASRACTLLIGSSVLLSPYFRAESYWVSTDIFPLFLVIVTALLLDPIQDNHQAAKSQESLLVRILLLAVVSWSAFYCRQTYLFLPFYVFVVLFSELRAYRGRTVLLFGALGVPAIYLVHLWKGLTPPSFRHHQGLALSSIASPLSIVLIYSLPFLFEMVVREKRRLICVAGEARFKWMYLIAGWITFLAVFHSFHFNSHYGGGGIAAKLLDKFGQPGRYLFLTSAYFGVVILLFMFRRAQWKRRVLLISFFLPAFVMKVFFQRYYDPVLVVLFFLFWERDLVERFLTVRTAVILMVFNAALLGGAIAYNAKSKPVFLPIGSHRLPAVGPVHSALHTETR